MERYDESVDGPEDQTVEIDDSVVGPGPADEGSVEYQGVDQALDDFVGDSQEPVKEPYGDEQGPEQDLEEDYRELDTPFDDPVRGSRNDMLL